MSSHAGSAIGFTAWVSWWLYPSRTASAVLAVVFVLSWSLFAVWEAGRLPLPARLRATSTRPATVWSVLVMALVFAAPILVPGRPHSLWARPPGSHAPR